MKCPYCGNTSSKVKEKTKKLALYLISQGFTNAKISRFLEVSRTTVGRWRK